MPERARPRYDFKPQKKLSAGDKRLAASLGIRPREALKKINDAGRRFHENADYADFTRKRLNRVHFDL